MTLRHLLLPPLAGGSTATVEQWYKQPGDVVVVGDPLLLVRTERVVVDLPIPIAGRLGQLHATVGDSVQVGGPLADMEQAQTSTTQSTYVDEPRLPPERVRSTPLARKLAAAQGYDLATIQGSGYGGRIMRADIVRIQGNMPTITSASSTVATFPTEAQDGFALDIPVALTVMAVEVDRAFVLGRAAQQAWRSVVLTLTTCVAYAVSQELLTHRLLTAVWKDTGLLLQRQPTVTIEDGGEQWVIRDAAAFSLLGLARAMEQPLASDGSKHSFTVRASTAWWTEARLVADSAATLTVGQPSLQLVITTTAADDRIEQHMIALLTLCYDARILTQPEADTFLHAVKQRVEGLQ